jgi:hypothetical protein
VSAVFGFAHYPLNPADWEIARRAPPLNNPDFGIRQSRNRAASCSSSPAALSKSSTLST